MILPLAFVLGAVIGTFRARARGGNRLDQVQYAVAHGIGLSLIAVIVLLIVQSLMQT